MIVGVNVVQAAAVVGQQLGGVPVAQVASVICEVQNGLRVSREHVVDVQVIAVLAAVAVLPFEYSHRSSLRGGV